MANSNFANGREHFYQDGTGIHLHDVVRHVATRRKGIVQMRYSNGRILVRWYDDQGQRQRRSSVNADKLELVSRETKAVAA